MQGTPILILGTRELKGKVQTLPQPFVVMRARKRKEMVDKEGDGHSRKKSRRYSMEPDEERGAIDGEYVVAGVVRKKMLFDAYPKSIMR